MEGAQQPASVGDALQADTGVLVPQPGDDDFDPTAPQPGDPEYDEWVAAQAAAPARPSERIDAGGPIRVDEPEELRGSPLEPDLRRVVAYAIEPGLAVGLLGYLGQMPHDEVRHLVDGLRAAEAIHAETAASSSGEPLDQPEPSR